MEGSRHKFGDRAKEFANFPAAISREGTPAVPQGAPDLHTSSGLHCQTIKHMYKSYLNISNYSKLQLKNATANSRWESSSYLFHSSYFLMPLRPRPYSVFYI